MRIGLSVRKIFLLAAVLLAAASPTGARAQAIDLDATRLPISPVDSAWRFHLGDDARWAQPDFDDSNWPTLQPTTDWIKQGYPKRTEFAWFRFRLRAPAHTQSLVVELPTIEKSYQLFSDGKLIAQVGTLPPGPAHNVIGSGPRLHPSRSLRLQRKGDHGRASSLAGSNCRRYAKERARRQRLRRTL